MNNNSNTRKYWTIAGFEYSSPIKIGAGTRAKYQERLMQEILKSPNSTETIKMIAELSVSTSKKKGPNLVVPPEAQEEYQAKELEKMLNDKYEAVVKAFAVQQIYAYRLVLLEVLLRPENDAPPVSEIFDIADEEEIVAVENFFQGKSPSKIVEETIGSQDSNLNQEAEILPMAEEN